MINHCPACATDVAEFEPGLKGRPRAKCPNCNALERHRLLAVAFHAFTSLLIEARVILEIAPHGPTKRRLRTHRQSTYIGLDLEPRTGPNVLADVTALPLPTGSVDAIVCSHVLEHVRDDGAAIREFARVLNSSGVAFIMVPREAHKPTDEEADAPANERIRRFGQADHVRLYGDDFERRLYTHGLFPTAVWPERFLSPEDIYRFGLQPREHLWICRTRRVGTDHFPGRRELERELSQEVARRRRLELDPPVRIVRGIQRRLRRLRPGG